MATISNIRPTGSGYSRVNSLNYSLANESKVSDTYAASQNGVTGGVFNPVDSTPPVSYPTAQTGSIRGPESMEATKAVSKAYNNIASSFEGRATGYTSRSTTMNYGTAGSSIDVYA